MASRAINILLPIPALAVHLVVLKISSLIFEAVYWGSSPSFSDKSKNASSQLIACIEKQLTLRGSQHLSSVSKALAGLTRITTTKKVI